MSDPGASICPICAAVVGLGGPIRRLYGLLDRVPYAALALPLRLAVATVFWNSGMTKLADWNAALALFNDEYQVPLLSPEPCRQPSADDRGDHARPFGSWIAD